MEPAIVWAAALFIIALACLIGLWVGVLDFRDSQAVPVSFDGSAEPFTPKKPKKRAKRAK